jgi:hypothetical protein
LVIATKRLARSTLLQRLPAALCEENWSFLVYTDTAWLRDAQEGSLFIEHVRLEGETLYDANRVLDEGAGGARAPRSRSQCRPPTPLTTGSPLP